MKMSKSKIIVLAVVVGVLALSAMAFTPLTGLANAQTAAQTDPDEDVDTTGTGPRQALADALGVTVEELNAAYKTAAQQAIKDAVNEALEKDLITQERADKILNALENGDGRLRKHVLAGMVLGDKLDAQVAEELGISLEDFQAAKDQVFSNMIAQAVEDGKMTQTMADLLTARQAASSYFEEARVSAYQSAVEAALSAGAIDQTQADLLLDNVGSGFPGGFGLKLFGGRGGHPHP